MIENMDNMFEHEGRPLSLEVLSDLIYRFHYGTEKEHAVMAEFAEYSEAFRVVAFYFIAGLAETVEKMETEIAMLRMRLEAADL